MSLGSLNMIYMWLFFRFGSVYGLVIFFSPLLLEGNTLFQVVDFDASKFDNIT